MAYSDYKGSQDILSISSYNSHSDSQDTDTPDGLMNDGSGDFCIEDFMNPEYFKTSEDDATATAVAVEPTEPTEPTKSYPRFDPNDPLRYFLEIGEITPNEYDKWRLIKEEPTQSHPSLTKHKRKTPDFGPGYNSDSDPASDDEDDRGPTIEYGYGYSVHADEHTDPSDPWNPTPDTTQDRRYTKIATDGTFLLKRLTQSLTVPLTLSNSFELKLAWERFTSPQTLQDFWQANALKIYEALQDLQADYAKVRRNRPDSVSKDIPLPSLYHSTPIETLENTFETIGRMSRCIAEDFNTQSVVNYVEEFLVSLYREIEFNALVEAYEHITCGV